MGLGARGGWAVFIVGTLLVLALLKAVVDSEGSAGNTPHVPASSSNEFPNSTMQPSTTSVSSATVATLKSTAKPSTTSTTLVIKNVTVITSKPTTASQKTTSRVITNMTSTTLKSTPKITSVSQNTSQVSTPTMATTHNSSVTSVSSPVSISTTVNSKENQGPRFDVGSFVGGIALTLGILSLLYIGCKMYYSRRGIQYRTIDEHDAII